jgi:glutamine amidotransferase
MTRAYIVDYGVGNIGSLQNMYKRVTGERPELTKDLAKLEPGDRLMLPGVGNFGFAMNRLNELDLADSLREIAQSGKIAMLGICLGAQLLLDGSDEASESGLGIIAGRSQKFNRDDMPDNLRIPHMGWTEISCRYTAHPLAPVHEDNARFYFVHSFRMMPELPEHLLFAAHYGIEFCAGVCSKNVVGVQFHPEKSHRFGMQFLKSFANWEIQ